MPLYLYEGRNSRGELCEGKVKADSTKEATQRLRKRGIKVMQLQESKSLFYREIQVGRAVKPTQFVLFLRQLATLIRAGVTIVEAIRILIDQTESRTLQHALEKIEEELRQGHPLSKAMAQHPRIFTPLIINMVKAGEASGTLDDTLDRMAAYYEKQHRLRQKVISALTYPVAVGIFAIAVIIFLLATVVPMFADMFLQFGSELPAITQFVLDSSAWIQMYWWIIAIVIATLYTVLCLLKRNKTSKYYLDYAKLKLPIVGKIIQKSQISRMSSTLSSLFVSSVPILQAFAIVEEVLDNEVMVQLIHKSRHSLGSGESITVPLKSHWVFPPMVTQMIAIGEQTGTLDQMLDKVAQFYETEVEQATERLQSLIEPTMIIFLAVIVGTIVLSIMVPMFELFNQIN